ncbi:tRNA uridine-5-carboxymethylaminomethyl(34) synthesis enzyme MnmG [Peredibacter starrii]|uniref:tRNA uridine 5-carboxymethylaminomethyl modification enzyme MnmG n=1 Tax=Peredibacter starrii TaxID=28202 RepID=A0AAX4HQ12_9BACT|nr:tRNA uridine-5-carboxymethylaminomethyl(34) synthesis enzyme MnmG [Peredibacter starrii]WPU65395.1 tRNA uridine-5-carboxymethylaminomethyl(34) synthesis enzyme MnmG [Peredibacter starrii]
MKTFDIMVVGGGHAGIEAAYIASQFNLDVAIITIPGIGLGSAPCNPSVGGVGKGQVVRELDALGGLMGILADKAGIQFRTLNDSKGFAVQSSRVQIDKDKYSEEAEKVIASIPNITVIREKVVSIEKTDVFTVKAQNTYTAKKIIMTVGTFLNGKLHTGSEQTAGGRVGCDKSAGLQDLFAEIKTRPQRFKTGTPPRLDKDTIDYSKLEEQPSDSTVRNFHCLHTPFERHISQVSCWLARTNLNTMEIIRANKEKSPMFNGQIKGVGARYCPSIEDKAYRYPDKQVHHVFIEPEGLDLDTMYPSGISSSLPKEVQEEYVRSIEGLEKAEIKVYGYAVEYDVIDTTDLKLTLEHVQIENLYFAGQVNGTSGYEEAAGQGFIAGANAALSVLGLDPLILSRHESYIGVMIEDLTSNTRDEPYRLFTARSENRLFIREDNSLLRMSPYRTSFMLNLPIDKYQRDFIAQYEELMNFCDETMISEKSPLMKQFSGEGELQQLVRRMSVSEILRQAWLNPITTLETILSHHGLMLDYDLIRTVAISKKYDGYIKRSEDQFAKLKKMDNMRIDWEAITASSNISFECKQRIARIKPDTFGQLKLIEGIRPATLAVVAAKAL